MPRRRLTALFVERATPPLAGQVEYFDELLPGFGLRISYKGSKSWFLTRRMNGIQKRFTLGRYPTVSLQGAREVARRTLVDISNGIDPRGLAATEHDRAKIKKLSSFGSVGDEFLNKYVIPKLRPRTVEGYISALKGRYTASWKDWPLTEVTKRHVIDVLEELETQGKHATARQLLAYNRKFFSWCVARDLVTTNPCAGIRTNVMPRPRERVLSLGELRRVWASAMRLGGPGGGLVAVLVLTGQRRGETAGMRWQDLEQLDEPRPVWRIPSTLTKNGRPHTVPLSDAAVQVIRAQHSRPRSEFVFSNGVTALSNFSGIKEAVDAELIANGEGPLEPWTMHDIRRSLVTGMNELGITTPHVIEAIVNHISGHRSGIAGVYNRATYIDERTRALSDWSKLIASDQNDNVLSWRRQGSSRGSAT